MKSKLNTPFLKAFLTSAVPFLVGSTAYLVEKVAFGAIQFSKTQQIVKQIRQDSFKVYSNYSLFIAVMLLLHLSIQLLSFFIKHLIKQLKPDKPLNSQTLQSNTLSGDVSISFSDGISSTLIKHQELGPISLKKIGSYTFMIILQYSIIYSIFLILCIAAPILFHCVHLIFYGKENSTLKAHIWTQENSLEGLQTPLRNTAFQKEIKNEYSSARVLAAKDTTDITQTIASLKTDSQYEGAYIIRSNDTNVLLFSDTKITSVNISDIISPTIISSSVVGQGSGIRIINVSPNGQIILYQDSSYNLFIANASNLQSQIKLEQEYNLNSSSNASILSAFSPDGTSGYFFTNDLFQFNMSSPKVIKALSFNKATPESLMLSTNGQLAYIALSADSQDSTISILNITNPTSPGFLANISMEAPIDSFTASSDDKMLYVLADGSLRILDISVSGSPFILSSGSRLISSSETKLTLSSTNDTLVIIEDGKQALLIDVSDPARPSIFKPSELSSANNAIFSVDGEYAFINSGSELQIVSFLVNLQLQEGELPFTSSNLESTIIPVNDTVADIVLSSDGILVIAVFQNSLGLYTVSDENTLTYQTSLNYTANNGSRFIKLSIDDKTAFLNTGDKLLIFDIESNQIISSTSLKSTPSPISISPDSKSIITYKSGSSDSGIYAIDITDSKTPGTPELLFSSTSGSYSPFAVTKTLLFVSDSTSLNVYDILNIGSPALVSSITLLSSNTQVTSTTVAPDEITLLVTFFDSQKNVETLMILDISDVTNINILGTIDISNQLLSSTYSLTISTDSKRVFIPRSPNILILDISNRAMPNIFSFIPTSSSQNSAVSIAQLRTENLLPILVADGSQNLSIFNSKNSYAVDITTSNFKCGSQTTQDIILLQQNDAGKYNLVSGGYKFIEASIYSLSFVSGSPTEEYSSLPNWMTFDKDNDMFSVAPTSQETIGFYSISSVLSTQVMLTDFGKTTADPSDLMLSLKEQGYLDNEYYITSIFSPDQKMTLPAQYVSTEQEIRAILSGHYYEILTSVSVQSSLYLQQANYALSVTTLSQFPVSLSINLLQSSDIAIPQCRFVTEMNAPLTPIFAYNNTKINFFGPLYDLNTALQSIIIDLNNVKSCDGTISINDSLNPTLNQTFSSISDFFMLNQSPFLSIISKTTLQSQIDLIAIYPNSYFVIVIDPDTFSQTNLKASLRGNDAIPWLTLDGFTLSGIPPDSNWPHFQISYNFELSVSNEYKSTQIPLTLQVHGSAGRFLGMWRLLLIILIIVCLWVYFSTILNIFYKKLYRYPTDLFIGAGTEITPSVLLPIALIGEDLAESRFIINELKRSIAPESTVQLEEYFFDIMIQQINAEKLFSKIETTVMELNPTKQRKIPRYSSGVDFRKDLINQIILNEVVLKRITSKQEEATFLAFEGLKEKWTSLIQKGKSHSWQLSINESRLAVELCAIGYGSDSTMLNEVLQVSMNNQSAPNNLNAELIDSSKQGGLGNNASQVNLQLLKSALIAHAFQNHHLGINTIHMSLLIKEKTNGKFFLPESVNRFLKLDLEPLLYSKGSEIGYGIHYRVVNDIVEFFGAAERNIIGKTLIVQINNQKGRILRELWLNGVAGDSEFKSLNRDYSVPL